MTVVRFLPPRRRRPSRRVWYGGDGAAVLAIGALLALAMVSAAQNGVQPATATETTIVGRAKIVDGDTIEIDGERVRLWGIDAPESAQGCTDENGAAHAAGPGATAALADLVGGQTLRCKALDVDRFGRTVARCTVGEAEVSAAMVAGGWAWDYARYSHGAYAVEEAAARAQGAGVWRWSCETPWRWRRDYACAGRCDSDSSTRATIASRS